MTREEAIARLEANRGAFVFKETNEALDMAIEALKAPTKNTNAPTDTPTDLISRQDALAEFIDDRDVFDIMESIESLPSAEPKTGKCKDCTHWDKLDYEAPRQGWCYQFEEFTDADEYCSRCAMMRGESDE